MMVRGFSCAPNKAKAWVMQTVPTLATVRLLAALTPCAEQTAKRYLSGERIKGHFLRSRLEAAKGKLAKIESMVDAPASRPATPAE